MTDVAAPAASALAPDTAGYPKPAYAGYALVLLMLAAIISLLDRQILTLLVVPVRHDLGISDTQVSLLQGFAFALFYTFMGVPLGFLADRLNRRNLIIAGILVWSVMTVASGLSHNFLELFICRVGVGIGEAVLHPAAYSIMTDYFPLKQRGRVFSMFSAAATWGIALSLILGGLVLAALGGNPTAHLPFLGALATWKVVFIIVGLPGLVLALLMLTLKEPVRRERAKVVASGASNSAARFIVQNWKAVGLVLAVNGLVTVTGYGVIAWMATGFVRTYHVTLSQAGLICGGIILVAAVLGSLVGGALGDRWTARGVVGGKMLLPVMSGLVGSVAFAGWWLVNDIRLAIAFGVLAYTMQCATTAIAPAALAELVPNELRGRLSAIYLLVSGVLGIGLGPTAVALITDYVFHDDAMVRYSMVCVAVPALLTAAAIAWFGRRAYTDTVNARRAELSN